MPRITSAQSTSQSTSVVHAHPAACMTQAALCWQHCLHSCGSSAAGQPRCWCAPRPPTTQPIVHQGAHRQHHQRSSAGSQTQTSTARVAVNAFQIPAWQPMRCRTYCVWPLHMAASCLGRKQRCWRQSKRPQPITVSHRHAACRCAACRSAAHSCSQPSVMSHRSPGLGSTTWKIHLH